MAQIKEFSGADLNTISRFGGVSNTLDKINGVTVVAVSSVSAPAAAYSVRLLGSAVGISSYTGPCMRVRRNLASAGTGHDDEADVAFDTNGEISLDSAVSNFNPSGSSATTLGEFLAASGYTDVDSLLPDTVTATVSGWYDQSGNSNNATQSTPSLQPQIYNGTAVITENGKPALEFVSDCLANSNSRTVTAYTAYVVGTYSASGGSTRILTNSPGADYNRFVALYATNNTTVRTYTDGNNVAAVTTSINTQLLLNFEHTGSVLTNYANGTAGTPYNDATFNFSIPGDSLGNNAGQPFSGMAQECIIYDSDQSSNRTGIETDINSEYLIYQPTDAPTSGLLATYTGAAAAYSVRQLSDKAVIAMRVRRDSDDEERNIGWDANGDLDTQAISDFCDTANGYVTRWWDQSTNGNHADQPVGGTGSNTSQPQIYNGTAVITENGKPAVKFDIVSTTENKLVMASAVSAVTMSIVVKVDANAISSNSYLWSNTSISEGSGFHGGGASGSRTGYGVQIITPTSESFQGTTEDFDQHLVTYHNGATDTLFQDGSSYATGALSNTPSVQRLGSRGSYQLALDGKIQELVLWDTSTQQSNRTGIESDINDYFSIYT